MNKLFFLLLVGGLVASYVLLTQPVPEQASTQSGVAGPAASATPEPITAPADAPMADAIPEPVPAPTTEPESEFAPVAAPEDAVQPADSEPVAIEPSTDETAPMPTIELPVADTETLQPLPANPAASDTLPTDTPQIQTPAEPMPEPPSMQDHAPIAPVFQPTADETAEAVFRDPNDLYEPSLAPEQALPTPLPAE